MNLQESNIPCFTVSRISDIIKNTLEQTFSIVSVNGEVSNLSISAKYAFFSVKDKDAVLRCVSWNPKTLDIKEGDSVIITGKITAYKGSSSYQMTAYRVEKQGVGNIAKAFQELKERLQKEGLFDAIHKKPLPKFVQSVGVISAKGSAALEDVLVNLKETIVREIYFLPAVMQGKSCTASVINALEKAQNLPVDAIIIARGGGSFEDLNEFNNEVLARKVFACKIPVISAIGHEVDFTILDFIADVRSPTPTHAARIISIQKTEVIAVINTKSKVINERTKFEIYRIKNTMETYAKCIKNKLEMQIYTARSKFESIAYKLNKKAFLAVLEKAGQRVLLMEAQIEKINPQNALNQGFALLESDGKYYDDPAQLPEKFRIITKKGNISAKKLDN
jgi:exodeoxyribonuclease VII large subunit